MSKLKLVPCPLCQNSGNFYAVNNTDFDLHIKKHGDLYEGVTKSKWQVCGRCGFVHQNPRPSVEALNQFYLESGYHPSEIDDAWLLPENYLNFAKWYYQEKVDYALKCTGLKIGRVFDVGFGQGGALKLFAAGGWEAYGVEADATFFKYAKDTLGLPLIQEGVLTSEIKFENKVDLVFSNHTFEHIADLHDAMSGLQKILKPGGYVFTAIPTYYKNRSNLSLQWLNSSHYSMFTHNSLNQLFSYYGLEEVTHTYRGWRKEIDDLWHVARFTGKRLEPNRFYENPRRVSRYVNIINPINSIINHPFYSNYAHKVQKYAFYKHRLRMTKKHLASHYLWYCTKLLFNSPQLFLHKVSMKVKKSIH